MATGKQQEKEPLNVVHQNAIFCETVTKEQRHQKLYTNYGFNPYKKSKQRAANADQCLGLHSTQLYAKYVALVSIPIIVDCVLAGKPNLKQDSEEVGDGK